MARRKGQHASKLSPPTRNASKGDEGVWKHLGDVTSEMVVEAVGTALTIIVIYVTHLLLESLIGKDEKFFSYVPVAWLFDAAHVALIVRLIWRCVRTYND